MKKLEGKHIIVEIIPNHSNSKYGYIVQLSALKLDGLKLIGRMDYRVTDNLVENKDLLSLISYDKENFNYTENKDGIIKEFVTWSEGIPLLIIDNFYTIDYLKNIANEKESVFSYLNMKYNDNIFDELIKKYKLEPSNYIVDLLYESLINESNN